MKKKGVLCNNQPDSEKRNTVFNDEVIHFKHHAAVGTLRKNCRRIGRFPSSLMAPFCAAVWCATDAFGDNSLRIQ